MLGVLLGYLFLQMILREEPDRDEARECRDSAADESPRRPVDWFEARRAG